ncbi:MAG: DNA-processing protein DprA [Sphaerochaetaceae bacterium]
MKFHDLLSIALSPIENRERFILLSHGEIPHIPRKRLISVVSALKERGAHIIFSGQKEFPGLLSTLQEKPFFLCHQGKLPDPDEMTVTLCGTRHPDFEGASAAYQVALEAALNGISVVTSLSYGCDRAAVKGALDGGGHCYLTSASGLLRETRALSPQISLLSVFPPDMPQSRLSCKERNTLTVSLSPCTYVIQAPLKSGALLCVREALDNGREVRLLPSALGPEPVRLGGLDLLDNGCLVVRSLFDAGVPITRKVFISPSSQGEYHFGNRHFVVS